MALLGSPRMKHFIVGKANGTHVQFFRYIVVGGSSALIDLIAFTVAVKMFDIHYLYANVISFIVAFIWNYGTSVLWVFESKHSRKKEFFMVLGIAALGLLWTEILLYLFVEYVSFDEFWAKVLTQIIVLFWNFWMRKKVVFK